MVKRVADAVFHSDDVAWMPWSETRTIPFRIEGANGDAWVKVLGREVETGAESLLYKFDAGWSAEGIENTAAEDLLVLEGDLTIANDRLDKHSYSYRPAGTRTGPCHSDGGAVVVSFAAAPFDPLWSKIGVRALHTEAMPWQPYLGGEDPSYWIKMLRADEENLQTFFLMKARATPHAEQEPYREPATLAEHEPPEEAFVIQGKTMMYDGLIQAPIWLTAGAFVHRAACSKHRTMLLFEEQVTYTHNWYAPGHEGQEAAKHAVYPVETEATRGARQGLAPRLARRW